MNFRQKEWINPYKMYINTGHKTFDKQTVCISSSACIAPTQYSSMIRSEDEQRNEVNRLVDKGELRRYDLKRFSNIPMAVQEKLDSLKKQRVFLYHFFYFKGVRITVGYVITSFDHDLIFKWHNHTKKNELAIEEIVSYITRADVP